MEREYTPAQIRAEFKQGDSVTCKIHGQFIEDAKINIQGNRIHICQNTACGNAIADQLGYNFSWMYDEMVKELKKVKEKLEPLPESEYF